MKKEHIGSDFDDFLREENLLETSEGDGEPHEDQPAGSRAFVGPYESIRDVVDLGTGCVGSRQEAQD